MLPIIINNPESAIKLTVEQAALLGIDTTQEQIHGELKTFGVWNIPVNYKALCMSGKLGRKEGSFFESFIEKSIHGKRTMSNIRQSSYELDGYVSVKGKKYSCFTSSQLFEVNGKLIDVAVIHARIR